MAIMPNIRISGPLAPYIGGVWSHVLAQGYTPLTGRNMLRLVSHLSRWLVDTTVRLSELTREHVEVFLEREGVLDTRVISRHGRSTRFWSIWKQRESCRFRKPRCDIARSTIFWMSTNSSWSNNVG